MCVCPSVLKMLIYEYCNGAAYHVQLSQCYAEPPYVRMACVWMVFGIPRYEAMPPPLVREDQQDGLSVPLSNGVAYLLG